MPASTREEIVEVFNALDADVKRLCDLTFDAFTTQEWMRAMERLEKVTRQLRTPQHVLINHLQTATEEELGAKLPAALADRLRITKAEANRRIAEADDLGERRALTGEPLEPLLTATAQAQRQGLVGDAHVKVIRNFIAHLPTTVDVGTWEAAEKDLAGKACDFRPDQVAKYAHELMELLHPDGDYTEDERARKRGLTLGPQQYDGMSRISGLINPELRALLEAAWAKLAAPGAATPEGETEPDTRSQCQRNHDALVTAIRELFASGVLGTHKGLPVSIIVTTTLSRSRQSAHRRRHPGPPQRPHPLGRQLTPLPGRLRPGQTAGAVPHQALRQPGTANHVDREGRWLHPPRLHRPGLPHRSPPRLGLDQHLLHRHPRPHITFWGPLAPDNRLAEKGWTTRKNAKGDTEWRPPAHLDHGQPRVNTFHHPEKLFAPDDDEPV